MSALANVALTDTFDTWRIRTNQIIVKTNDDETYIAAAYNKANAANVLAYSTGIGANAFASATISGASGTTATVAYINRDFDDHMFLLGSSNNLVFSPILTKKHNIEDLKYIALTGRGHYYQISMQFLNFFCEIQHQTL